LRAGGTILYSTFSSLMDPNERVRRDGSYAAVKRVVEAVKRVRYVLVLKLQDFVPSVPSVSAGASTMRPGHYSGVAEIRRLADGALVPGVRDGDHLQSLRSRRRHGRELEPRREHSGRYEGRHRERVLGAGDRGQAALSSPERRDGRTLAPNAEERYDAQMTSWRWMAGAMALAACTLTTPLDGFADPVPVVNPPFNGDAGDGGSDAPDVGPMYAAEVAKDNPLSYWRLGETTGTLARDERGVRGGTYVGTVALGQPGAIVGDRDTAVKLDGTSACVRISDTLAFSGLATFTVELWINPSSVGIERRLASRRTEGVESGYRVFLVSTQLRFERWVDGGSNGPTLAPLPPVDTWTHVAATYDGSSTRLWVNGTMADSAPSHASIPAVSADFVWGANSLCDGNYFSGVIDELAVYDHMLDSARIAAHIKAAGR